MDDVYVGMPVEGAKGRIGVVESVLRDPADDGTRVLVRRDSGEMLMLAPGTYRSETGAVRLNHGAEQNLASRDATLDPRRTQVPATDAASAAENTGASSSTRHAEVTRRTPYRMEITSDEDIRIPVLHEEAVVRTREVEGGGVRVHKTVTEREEVVQQPVFHEQVEVERITIGRVVDVAPEVREEGDTLIIPVLEEVLVVEKRLVLKEELRITKRRLQETEEARVVLREEQVRVERIDAPRTGE